MCTFKTYSIGRVIAIELCEIARKFLFVRPVISEIRFGITGKFFLESDKGEDIKRKIKQNFFVSLQLNKY